MFTVTEADAAAIRAAYHDRGELAAVVELRRRFPSIRDNQEAARCVTSIAGWHAIADRQQAPPAG